MTLIAAWKDKKSVWMAGDSGAFDDSTVIIVAEPKVWKTDTSLVGVSGSFRIMDLLRNSKVGEPQRVRDYLLSKVNEPGFPNDDWSVLIADKTGIYEIGSDFSVVKSTTNYSAIGACAEAALSALYVLEQDKVMPPKKRMELVANAAITHTTNARPPVKVLSL